MNFADDNPLKGTSFHYKYIDHGAQFRVYAILTPDNKKTGRVVKVPLDFDESKHVLEPHLKTLSLADDEIDRRVHALMYSKQQLPKLLQGMFAEDTYLMDILGNLKIIPVLAKPQKPSASYFMPLYFTQDHVIPMSEFMHPFRFAGSPPYQITISDIRMVSDLFNEIVKLHYRLWEYGIFDLTFKLENIGVSQRRKGIKAILVDGAEHTFLQEAAETALREQKWRHPLMTNKTDHLFLPIILQEEYTNIFERSFTIEEFRKRWRKRSNIIEKRAIQRLKIRERLTRSSEKELALWIKRQTVKSELYKGIPKERIDTTTIPQSDLFMLIEDIRVGKIPMTVIEQQEQAERLYATDSMDMWQDIYRCAFPATI